MSPHREWLGLVDVSGPFLSTLVLDRALPQGLETINKNLRARVRAEYESWSTENPRSRTAAANHRAWIRFVLADVLGFSASRLVEGQALSPTLRADMALHGETLRPDAALVDPRTGGRALLLLTVLDRGTSLSRPLRDRAWAASPETRMEELLRSTGVRLGIVTNGEQWMLVNAPEGETTGYVSWYALLWTEEPETLRAFVTLLGQRRFFAAAPGQSLAEMLDASLGAQAEVTTRLGIQVRQAVEVFIRTLDRVDQDRDGALLEGLEPQFVYEAALTVMMRLVFLFAAEERDLLLSGNELWVRNYGVSTLVETLERRADQRGEEILERSTDAWGRLVATFRAVYGGVDHDRMRLRAYGGGLFDPDRFCFLEGRAEGTSWRTSEAETIAIDNRTVLHLLRSLQYLETRGEAERVSFRALDVEPIGHVYEGLLDHTAVRAESLVVGLIGTPGSEPEVELRELEAEASNGDDSLVAFVSEITGKSAKTLARALEADPSREARLRTECGTDAIFRRVRRFAGIIRDDSFGAPVVIRRGGLYVTAGEDRRSSGAHYTPRELTREIVEFALEPLVYEGPAEGVAREQWRLRSPRELLELRICDPACGSAAFLVETCRQLGALLVEAWQSLEGGEGSHVRITPDGRPSKGVVNEQLIPLDREERLLFAERLVAETCLYGVDFNPLAVDIAKLSLWLLTLSRDQPFTFLDHAIKCGDSLLGVTSAGQVESFGLVAGEETVPFAALDLGPILSESAGLRRRIESFTVIDARGVEVKRQLLDESERAVAGVRFAADALVGFEFEHALETKRAWRETADEVEDRRSDIEAERAAYAQLVADAARGNDHGGVRTRAEEFASKRRPFHWVLEFPEVFGRERPGFDAIVGNPPFIGGQRLTGALGADYREYLVRVIGRGKRGSADLCAYFFLRNSALLRDGGTMGLLATNTIAEGDTREVGLDRLVYDGASIFRARKSRKWPGTANLHIAEVWARKGAWAGESVLDGSAVSSITPYLVARRRVEGRPAKLVENRDLSFQGSIVLGMGFVLEPAAARELIERDPRNAQVLFPYLNGEDLNSRPDQSPSRWVINFRNWPLDRRAAPPGYEGPVAADYPECLDIVRRLVKPERDRNKRKERRDRWWQYAEKAPKLYSSIGHLDRVLITARVSKYTSIVVYVPGIVFHQKIEVFLLGAASDFAALQSSFHTVWVREWSSSLKGDINYSSSDCFDTFPRPNATADTESFGESYSEARSRSCLERGIGLTKLYNLVHDPKCRDSDIVEFRELAVSLDKAVAAAYGWGDLDLCHGFHETAQGLRFTVSEAARTNLLDRLLEENHRRHAAEPAAAIEAKRTRKSAPATAAKRPKAGSAGAHERSLPLFEIAPSPDRPTEAKAAPARADVADLPAEVVIAALRQSAAGRGWINREELVKLASERLGYARLSSRVSEMIARRLSTGVRRGVFESDAGLYRLALRSPGDIETTTLLDAIRSVTRIGSPAEREELVRAVAVHLSFERVSEPFAKRIRKAISLAIRRGMLERDGQLLRRT